MAIQGRSRIAEVYVQVVPEIGNLTPGLTGQINQAVQSPAMAQSTAQAGNAIGQNVGNTAGTTAGTTMGRQMMAGLAAAGLGAFLQGQIAKVLDNGEIESSIKGQLALDEKQLEQVAAASKELYTGNYAESYGEAAEVMKTVVGSVTDARNMSKEQLTLLGRDFSNMTSEFELDAQTMAQALNNMVGTGFSADNTQAMSDMLAAYQSFGKAGGADFIDTMAEFSADFANIGVEGPQAIALISEAMRAGVKDTDVLGDMFQEFVLKMNDGTAAEVMPALGLDPESLRAEINKGGDAATEAFLEIVNKLQEIDADTATWAGIMGPKGEEYASQMMNMDWSAVFRPLEAGVGDLDKFDEDLTSIQDVLISLKNTIEVAFTDTLEPIIKKLAPQIKGLAGFFADNEEAAKALGLAVTGILIIAVAGLTVALWGLIAPILANPATWIMAGIVVAILAVAAAVWWLHENWTEVTNWMSDTWGGFMGFLEDSSVNVYQAFTRIKDTVTEMFQGAVIAVVTSINSMITALNTLDDVNLPGWMGGGKYNGIELGLLDVPKFGTGGTIAPKPGGTLGIIAEMGKPETIVDTGTVQQSLELMNDELLSNKNKGGKGLTVHIHAVPTETAGELLNRLRTHAELHGEEL